MNLNFVDKIAEKKRISHAYLIEVGDSYNTDFAVDIVKKILSIGIEDSQELEEIYSLINNDNYADLKIIRAEGNFIKKEQLIELMDEFKKTSLVGRERFYIMEYAENLNQSSANTILKFLEEPENNIVAILITKNVYSVLETIVSRCQVLNMNTDSKYNYELDVLEESVKYFKILVEKKNKAIAYLSELYSLKAEDIKKILKNWTIFYENAIESCYNIDESNKTVLNKEVTKTLRQVTPFDAVERLKTIDNMINLIDLNVNTRVILDMLFDLEDCV